MYAKDELLDNLDLLIQVATNLKAEKERSKRLQTVIEANKSYTEFE
jgi:anti-repressor protein